MRRLSLFLSTLLYLGLATSCDTAETNEELPPPNILWIVSEDNSPFLGIYGDEFATTPTLDSMATVGVMYENAFATTPVCAPSRSTIITGMYANSMGTQHMRSNYPIPEFIKFFPRYLREAGYYTTNNAKKDYNTVDQPEAWNESSNEATYKNRQPGQPFFHIKNLGVSHESSVHDSIPMDELRHNPEEVPIPPYHPQTEEMKHDWAQYYDKVEDMDRQVGEILAELRRDGLADSTIIFYYSDHGGVLGRSKRFVYESGLRIPMIVHFPEMYRHLAPAEAGSTTDRIVTFVDLAPTILSLAGIEVPEYMQGVPFLGEQTGPAKDFAFAYRGRMDERFDMVRSVRDKEMRYTRNFMPHKIYGQYIEYLWRAPSMKSWEREYKAGRLNEVQSRFWEEKPVVEFYDAIDDPHNITNLTNNVEYQDRESMMQQALHDWMIEIRDVGLLPEPMMLDISKETTLYEYMRQDEFPIEAILETAEMATSKEKENLDDIIGRLNNTHPLVRYWATVGCRVLGVDAAAARNTLINLLDDPQISVRISAAEALYAMGSEDIALNFLVDALESENMMARTMVLNVLEIMGDAAKSAKPSVEQLVEGRTGRDYDLRAAQRLLEKWNSAG